jgi:hypothetical protein
MLAHRYILILARLNHAGNKSVGRKKKDLIASLFGSGKNFSR